MDSKVLSYQRYASIHETQHNLLKRLFDISFSLFVLSLLSPLFFFIIIAIRLSSQGKAIYVQPRLGRGGVIFKCYKFRTMHIDAEVRLQELLFQDPQKRAEWERHQKLKNDPRVFRLGHFLRRTSLDELPQFWNVLKGDLSVVGPRPYMVSQLKDLAPFTQKILSVRPGITGLWQTSGRSLTTFQKRIVLDAEYVNKRSFWLDLGLILKTIPIMFFPKDAY